MTPLAACTIVSANYLSFARVLARSFRRHQPDGRFVVLLVDRVDGRFDPADEPFEVIEIEALADRVPNLRQFLFQYTLLEANTAIKPFFLEHLFETLGVDKLVYFDPDIWILGSLEALSSQLERASVVLTPHLDAPISDGAYPGEQAILQSGTYNLGFVGLRGDAVGRALLRWWQERLWDRCVVRIDQGLFVDQKWMDLVPGLFENVEVLRDPGYNVAYWNLHGRAVDVSAGHDANGVLQAVVARRGSDEPPSPLVFFHFSGIQPDSLEGVSKHQDRFTLAQIGDAAALYRHYRDRLIEEGFRDHRGWGYAFGKFSNGIAVPDAARALYLEADAARRHRFGDPFEAEGDRSFFAWMNAPVGGGMSRLLVHLAQLRPDLRATFADPAGADAAAYAVWLRDMGPAHLKIDRRLLDGLVEAPEAPTTVVGLGKRIARRAFKSPPAQLAKAAVKKALGPERFRALKRRLKPPPPADPVAGPAVDPSLPDVERVGLNVVGYLRAETGMGEAGRSMVQAAEAADLPVSPHALELGVVARQAEAAYADATSDFSFDINLLVVNADQVEPVCAHLGEDVVGGRYNVGLWLWELPDFPDALRGAFAPFHEIWTPSTFCADALSAKSPVPVRRVPLPVHVPPVAKVEAAGRAARRRLELDDDVFVALYLFNYLSVFERKNPLAAVEAFRRAFGTDASKRLILKTSQADYAPPAHARLLEAARDLPNVTILDAYLDREEIEGLLAACDVYLSLHRSEGYGLTVAEAMARGKVAVATPWSGVADFVDVNNGRPVRFALERLETDVGPYPAGSRWADPDVDDAARALRELATDVELRRQLGERARHDIEAHLSSDAVGRLLRQRVDEIVRRTRRPRPPGPDLEPGR